MFRKRSIQSKNTLGEVELVSRSKGVPNGVGLSVAEGFSIVLLSEAEVQFACSEPLELTTQKKTKSKTQMCIFNHYLTRPYMNLRYLLLAIIIIFFIACKPSSTSKKEQLARNYYQALDQSNFARIAELQFDSIRVKEGSYTSVYSVEDYVNWLKWDSVFQPTYEVLDITSDEEKVELTISKVCKRIQFLNGGPMISKEVMQFKEGKIYTLEIKDFTSYNGERWNAEREKLVNWIKANHPELEGFIYDQTLQGGINYLKALDLYQSRAMTETATTLNLAEEKKAILATLNNETKAAFQRDYQTWQAYWVHDNDMTKVYLDFPENTFSESLGWSEISGFVKDFFEKHPEPEPLPELLNDIEVRLYQSGAWVTYAQKDSLRGLKRETRLMEKVDGQWKIAGMQTTIYGFEQ
ncbi:hypothetical protein [Croceitalea rosinachiae]|uniref:SnoaL-like domain-containing protein n=1 Tax=Croceitalea rosinachiae TaxID=3075596 RepID=A0ABU3ABA8_9FLAO|nr:hypothetical protein [Croceitalea sp. F388]MDT0606842.1 hypothetical protein [Croceitalea sp. F388]